jgi:hypothetical protein
MIAMNCLTRSSGSPAINIFREEYINSKMIAFSADERTSVLFVKHFISGRLYYLVLMSIIKVFTDDSQCFSG